MQSLHFTGMKSCTNNLSGHCCPVYSIDVGGCIMLQRINSSVDISSSNISICSKYQIFRLRGTPKNLIFLKIIRDWNIEKYGIWIFEYSEIWEYWYFNISADWKTIFLNILCFFWQYFVCRSSVFHLLSSKISYKMISIEIKILKKSFNPPESGKILINFH